MGIIDNKIKVQKKNFIEESRRAKSRHRQNKYSTPPQNSVTMLSRDYANKIKRFQNLTNPPDRCLQKFGKTTKELLEASMFVTAKANGNVSDFSDWVYSLYQRKANPAKLAKHLSMEEYIDRERKNAKIRKSLKSEKQTELARPPLGWKLIYKHFAKDDSSALKISHLKVNGYCLFGKPDLVFKNRKGEIMIVEIKVTQAQVPKDGWPNIAAQLWAYAQADQWKGAPKILLAAEVYQASYDFRYFSGRVNITYDLADKKFQDSNAQLFKRYCEMCINP